MINITTTRFFNFTGIAVLIKYFPLGALLLLPFLQACTGVNTFPTVARPGDTVSVMVGGSEKVRKDTIDVSLTDINGVVWDLQSLGLVRSTFNLRPEGIAYGMHYSDFINTEFSWLKAHEQIQTVLVADIPAGAAPGQAVLNINLNVDDDSSGIVSPFTIALDIIPGAGSSSVFERKDFAGAPLPANFPDLEPAPYAKISFGDGSGGLGYSVIGAVSLVIDFDNTVVNGNDLNIYLPESQVRGTFSNPGAPFGDKQRMVYWRQTGTQVLIDIIAPQGIEGRYLQSYIVHPRGLVGDPLFSLSSATFYDLNGNLITPGTPILTYSP